MSRVDKSFSQLEEDHILRPEFAGFLRRLAGLEREALECYGPQAATGSLRRSFIRGRMNALEALASMIERGELTPELFFSDGIDRLSEPHEDMPGAPPTR